MGTTLHRSHLDPASDATSAGTMLCTECCGIMEFDDALPGDEFECPHCRAVVAFSPQDGLVELKERSTGAAAHADMRASIAGVEPLPPLTLGQGVSTGGLGGLDSAARHGLVSEPAARQRSARQEHLQAKGLPPADAPETEIMRIHPSMARTQPFLFAGLVLLTGLGLTGAGWMLIRERPVWLLSVPALLGASGGVWLLWWWLQTRGSEIRVTTKRLIDSDGIFNRRVTEVRHRDIKKIELRQTFFQRLCGVGEVSISADSDDGPEVFMAAVPRPHWLREVIDKYRTL